MIIKSKTSTIEQYINVYKFAKQKKFNDLSLVPNYNPENSHIVYN